MSYQSFPDALVAKVKEHPDKTFAIEEERTITYKQHLASALSFADQLLSAGIKKGDRVVIVSSQTISYLSALMGCYIIGAVTIPIERNSPPAHIDNVCRLSSASAVIGVKPTTKACAFIDISLSDTIDERYIGDFPLENMPVFPDGNDVLSVMFTTGTTGKSKGVVLSVRSQIALAENVRKAVYEPDDVVLIPLPLDHAYGIRRYHGVLLSGCTLVLLGIPLMLKPFFDAIEKNSVNVIAMTSSHAAMILNVEESKMGETGKRLRLIEFGSTTTPESLQERLKRVLPHTKLISTYGMTEAGTISTIDFHAPQNVDYCLGKPIVDGTMYVGDSEGMPLGANSRDNGRIYLTGPTLMNEYYGEPALTAEVLENGILKTADMGYCDEEGYIHYVGRADDVINAGAFKIAPQEIEDIVNEMPDIKECVCVPVPDNVLGNVPKLYVVMDENTEFSFKTIRSYLASRIDRAILPRYIEQIDKIPRTENGKIIRRNLRDT